MPLIHPAAIRDFLNWGGRGHDAPGGAWGSAPQYADDCVDGMGGFMRFKMIAALLAFLLYFVFPHHSALAVSYTLDSAIARALKANPSIGEKIQALESARMDVGVAQSYFWPRVSLVANSNRLRNSGAYGSTDELSNTSSSHGLRATLSLFAGFSHLNNLQRSMIEKDIAELQCRHAELELIANVQVQFFNLLQARRDLRYVKESIRRITTQLEAAQAMAAEIEKMTVKLELKAGEGGKIFGSVSSKEIAKAVTDQYGKEIDKKKLQLADTIKTVGMHEVTVKLHPKVSAKLKVQVESV